MDINSVSDYLLNAYVSNHITCMAGAEGQNRKGNSLGKVIIFKLIQHDCKRSQFSLKDKWTEVLYICEKHKFMFVFTV